MWRFPCRAALLISEVLYNEVGGDTGGEFLEIFNNGPAAIDLTNYKIGDEETSGGTGSGEAMMQFPAGASIPAGGIQLVARDANVFFTNYGFLPTYEALSSNPSVPDLTTYAAWDTDGGAINMANGGDQALILDGADSVVDAVSWGFTFAFDPPLDADAEVDGQSYERINPYVDTDTANDWRLGNPSSPGTIPVPEPATALLTLCMASLVVALSRFGRG